MPNYHNTSRDTFPHIKSRQTLSGAYGKESRNTAIKENERLEYSKDFKKKLKYFGNLTKSEIDELVSFNYFKGPSTLQEQFRKYYLQYKNEFPKKSEKMLGDIGTLSLGGDLSIDDIKAMCQILYKYISGAEIYYGGHSYYMTTSNGHARSIHSEPTLYMDGKIYGVAHVILSSRQEALNRLST